MSKDEALRVLRSIRATLDQLIAVLERPLPEPRIVKPKPRLTRRRTPAERAKLKEEAMAMRQRGLRVAEIARRLGISASYVCFLSPGTSRSSAKAGDAPADNAP